MQSCSRCPRLCASRTQIVLPTLPAASGGLLCIGEAPGRDEDLAGAGFVGSAGKTLRRLLAACGIEAAGFANMVRCRPPNNDKPTAAEIRECAPLLAQTLLQTQPRVVLLVGGTATQAFWGRGALASHIERSRQQPRPNVAQTLPELRDALESLGETAFIPMPHTSGLAWNRPSPFGCAWSVVGEQQVRLVAGLLKSVIGD